MLRILLLLAGCFIGFNFVSAQNRYIDSIQQLIHQKGLHDTSRIQLMIRAGNALARIDRVKARQQYEEAKLLAIKIKDHYLMAMSYGGIGKLFDYRYEDSSLYYYKLADSLYALSSNPFSEISRSTNKTSIATILRERGHFEEAITAYLDAINIVGASQANNKGMVLGVLYSNIGSTYHDLRQFDKALEYDLKALSSYKEYDTDPTYIAITELYVSGDYKDLGRMDESKKHIENAEMLAASLHSPDLKYRVHNSWGSYFYKLKEYDKAIAHYKKAIPFTKETDNLFQEMNCYRMIGFIYRDIKNYKESIPYLQSALALAKQLKQKVHEVELLKNLGLAHDELGNHKQSLAFYKGFINLSDTLKTEETKQKINEIENRYQASRKRDSILVLQKTNEAQQAKIEQKELQNMALIGGCILLVLLGFVWFSNIKNKNRLLVQNQKLHLHQLSELEKEKKLLAAQSLMKGQEEERSRLARDLHDGLGGLLSGVKLSMSSMKGNVFLSDENARSFEKVIVQLDQSISELRRVSHNMMPEALIKYGLKEALENYCENLNLSGGIIVQLQTYGLENRMEQGNEIVIYRIIQELLQNVIKHAEAKKVLIQLIREGDRFNLTVEDDGKGFDTTNQNLGAGLANIKARTEYLNGTMDIITREGEGTSVHIEGDSI